MSLEALNKHLLECIKHNKPVMLGCDGTYKIVGGGWVLLMICILVRHVDKKNFITHTPIPVVYGMAFSESTTSISSIVSTYNYCGMTCIFDIL